MTSPERPTPVRPVDYKGEPLDAERGPGLGCFWFQVGLLLFFIVLTPLTVAWNWPAWVSMALLVATIVLLLFAGQTVIFLLRLVAADRREGVRHAPRSASASRTVGQLEDAVHVDSLGRPIEAPDVAPAAPDLAPAAPDLAPATPDVPPASRDDAPATPEPPAEHEPGDRGVRE